MLRTPKRMSRLEVAPIVLGVLCLIAAWLCTRMVWTAPERRLPSFFIMAVVIAAWFGGLWPGILATALSVVGYMTIVPTDGAFWFSGAHRAELLASSVVFGVVISVLSGLRLRHMLRYQAERERLMVTLQSIGDAVISTDDRGVVTFLNGVAEKLCGWSNAEAQGKPLSEVFRIINEETRQPGENPVLRVLREGTVVGLANHTVLIGRDGKEIPIGDSAAPIREAGGQVEGVILIFRDVTESKRAERAMHESEARFRLVANQAPVGIWMTGPTGKVEWFSERWLEFAGMKLFEALATRWEERLHPEDMPRSSQIFAKALQHRQAFELECRMRRGDGVYRWVLGHGVPFYDVDGKFAGYLGTMTDISDRKEMEASRERQLASERSAREAAERAGKAKDEFLAMLSHELRTPLTPVLATLHALELGGRVPESLRDDLETIRRNTQLEARLIDDLLDITRISRNKLQLNPVAVDLHRVLASVVEICRAEIAEKGQRVELRLEAQRHFVRGDPARLQQIFWNLLKNAVKFSAEGGAIRIGTGEAEGGAVRVEVADEGIGIDPAELPHLFGAFEQGSEEVARRFGGLGLGLAIARALAEMHGGSVQAQSAGRGKGAAFCVELPTIDAEQLPAAADGARRATARRRKLRILLVEDHPDTARTMMRLLETMNHQVTTAGTVAAGVELALSGEFELIISDIRLPDGTGTELIRQVRTKSQTPAIALTGYGMEEDQRRSLEAGFGAHLTKPVDIDRLEDLLEEYGNGD